MELFIFARFHAREGCEDALAQAVRHVVTVTREEPGCLAIHGFCCVRDCRLFYIHSRWIDEVAFERHAEMPHTVEFIKRAESLIDHSQDVNRAQMFV